MVNKKFKRLEDTLKINQRVYPLITTYPTVSLYKNKRKKEQFEEKHIYFKKMYKKISKIGINFDKILFVFTTTNTTRVNVNFK